MGPEKLFSWKGWDAGWVVLWLILSIGFGILFHHTIDSVYTWWTNRKR